LLKRSTDSLDEETRLRFALLGLFVPKPAAFNLQAMAAAWDVDDPKPTARKLVNRGLIEPLNGGRFQMHALLVLHAKGHGGTYWKAVGGLMAMLPDLDVIGFALGVRYGDPWGHRGAAHSLLAILEVGEAPIHRQRRLALGRRSRLGCVGGST
jgi:hypothetical protein